MTPKTEPQAKRKTGRPLSKPDPVIMEEFIEWISDGKTMRNYCAQKGKPCWNVIYKWLDRDESFRERYQRAREKGIDAIAEDTIRMADEEPRMVFSENGERIDPAYVQWQKLRIETRHKLLAKWNPRKYGDKVGVEHSGNVGLSINIDLT